MPTIMHTESTILIRAPLAKVFEMTSDLSRWPALLPHYRWVRWISGGPDSGVVAMAALRDWLPISWTSEFHRNSLNETSGPTIHFRHLTAFTQGMEVRWIYEPTGEGVRVTIEHDLHFRWPLLAPVADPMIGDFMIGWVAPLTLQTFKKLLES